MDSEISKTKSNSIDLSIAIPTFNRSTFILQAIRSAIDSIAKTNLRWEIILLDNGSKNADLINLLKSFESAQIAFKPAGQTVNTIDNWNRSIIEARGAWIHLLHDDDYVDEMLYPKFEAFLKRSDLHVALFLTGVMTVDQKGGHLMPVKTPHHSGIDGSFFKAQAVANLVGNPGVIFNRNIAVEICGFSKTVTPYLSDWNFWFRMSKGKSVYIEPGILAYYRIHPNSGTLNENLFNLQDVLNLVEIQIKQAEINPETKIRTQYTTGFGRHLVRQFRNQNRLKEALRIAKSTFKIDKSLLNAIKILKCLLVG